MAKKGKKKSGQSPKTVKASVAKLPKKKCCVTAPKCKRCPLRMLKEGTLPDGFTVHKRKLVKTAKSSSGKKKVAA